MVTKNARWLLRRRSNAALTSSHLSVGEAGVNLGDGTLFARVTGGVKEYPSLDRQETLFFKPIETTRSNISYLMGTTADGTKGRISLEDFLPVSVRFYGASPSKTSSENQSAFQACFDYCRDNDREFVVPEGDYAIDSVVAYTGGTFRGRLIATNAGQSGPVFAVASIAADVADVTVSTVNTWTFIVKGNGYGSQLTGYSGKYIWWLTDSQTFVNRESGQGGDGFREGIIVNEGGNFYPPITLSKSGTWGAATTKIIEIRKKIRISGLTVIIASGSTERNSVVGIGRPNTILDAPTIINDSGTPISQGIAVSYCCHVSIVNPTVRKLGTSSTNYGINLNGTCDVTITGFNGSGMRRAFDSTGGKFTRIDGGSFPDGVGAHWHNDLQVTRALISSDGSSAYPVHYAGADLSFDDCDMFLQPEQLSLVKARNDFYELAGAVRITNSRINIDTTGANLSTGRTIINLQAGALSAGYDWGRLVYRPNLIVFEGNTVRQRGASYTEKTAIVTMGSDKSFLYGASVGGMISIKNNAWQFESGDGYKLSVVAIKDSEWTAGSGYDITVEDVPSLQAYLYCAPGRTDANHRHNVRTQNVGVLLWQPSPGAYRIAQLDAETITRAEPSGGRTTPVGDEMEAKVGPLRRNPDDFNLPQNPAKAWRGFADLDNWTAPNATKTNVDQALRLTASATDPQIVSPAVSISGETARYFAFRYRRIAGSHEGIFIYTTSGHGFTNAYKGTWNDPGINIWTTVLLDMWNPFAGGTDWHDSTITSCRLDISQDSGAVFDVLWAGFFSDRPAFGTAESDARYAQKSGADFTGAVTVGGTFTTYNSANLGYGQSTGTAFASLGGGRTGNGFSILDFIGDTSANAGLRIYRGNGGTNAISNLEHRGTGDFNFYTFDAAPIKFFTGGTNLRLTIAADGSASFTGAVSTTGNLTTTAAIKISGPAASDRVTFFQTNGLNRWYFGATNVAESGSNAGSDFFVASCNDAGSYTGLPFIISRATGAVSLTGTLTTANSANFGAGLSTNDVRVSLGSGRTGSGNTYIDLIGDATYPSYGARFIRTPGPNGNTIISHRGTGNIELQCVEAASIVFTTNNINRGGIDAVGNMQFGTVIVLDTNGLHRHRAYTVAALPTPGTAGRSAFASNCRAFNGTGTQEGSGAGTGCLVIDNGTAWKIAGTNVTAIA